MAKSDDTGPRQAWGMLIPHVEPPDTRGHDDDAGIDFSDPEAAERTIAEAMGKEAIASGSAEAGKAAIAHARSQRRRADHGMLIELLGLADTLAGRIYGDD